MDAPTDFWGIVVPGWIGAIGGLVGATVAVVSLLIAMRSNEKATAARAAEAEMRAVVIDTIAELQRENAEQPGILPPADDVRARRADRYAELKDRLRQPPTAGSTSPER